MPAQSHPTGDNWGSLGRLTGKFFVFTSVADGDTFSIPMADARFAIWIPGAASAAYGQCNLGTTSNGVTPGTFRLSGTGAGTLVVFGSGV